MSTVTAPARPTAAASPAPTTRTAGFSGTLRSEWIKLRSVRSTWWSLGIVAVITIGTALLVALAMQDAEGFEPIQAIVVPGQLTMLVVAVLGVVSVTGEYSSGLIRATFAATPVRGAVLAAKAIVMGVSMFLASAIIMFTAALVVTPVFAGRDLPFEWQDPALSTLPLLTASAAMVVYAIIGLGLGFLIRSSAGALALTIALLLVLPTVASLFSRGGPALQWLADAAMYLPTSASQSLILPQTDWGLTPTTAAVTLAAWTAASLLAAWAALRSRDA